MAISALAVILLAGSCRGSGQTGPLTIYDLKTRQTISGRYSAEALKTTRLVLVGEHHTNAAHTRGSSSRSFGTLNRESVPLSIGLEMFPKNAQNELDRWVAGELAEKDFEKTYLDNWNFPWRFIPRNFHLCRDKRFPWWA